MIINPIHILLIEDDEDDHARVRRLLQHVHSFAAELTWVRTAEEALEALESPLHDVCLLDYQLGAIDGLDVLRGARAAGCEIPVIFTTGHEANDVDLEAMEAGATSFLSKQEMTTDLLERTIRYGHERHRLQQEIERRTRLELVLKNQFVSRVSHELRLPLSSIRRHLTLVADGVAGEVTRDQSLYIEKALKNVHRLSGIIDALLEVTPAESGDLIISAHPMDLGDLCVEIIESFDATARAVGVELSAAFADDLPLVHADAFRLRQVLEQLVENALKFTPHGGDIHLSVSHEPIDGLVRVSLSDSGAGIVPEVRERIFERLYKESGTEDSATPGLGLGLFLCRQIIERLGGRIWVESAPDAGSTFTFTLRATDDPAEGVEPTGTGG